MDIVHAQHYLAPRVSTKAIRSFLLQAKVIDIADLLI